MLFKHLKFSILLGILITAFDSYAVTLLNPFTFDKPFGNPCFIENKGQFNNLMKGRDSISFGYDDGAYRFYFTRKGFQCRLSRKVAEYESEGIEKESNKMLEGTVFMEWIGSNKNCLIKAYERQPGRYTYGEKTLNTSGYRKIIYEAIYPNINLEYTVHDSGGIKYTLILKPGADIGDIKFRYTGKRVRTNVTKQGIEIDNGVRVLFEKELLVFNNRGEPIPCHFALKNGYIAFEPDSVWDNTQTISIDPWIGILGVPGGNKGHDVDYDNEGNLYVFGGQGLVSKYNNQGKLIWNFSGIINAINWTFNSYVSNFVVDKPSGKVYIGQGFSGGGTRIVRLDSSGNYDNFVTAQTNAFQELWDMNFNCANGTIYGMGGSTSSNLNLGAFDASGNFSPVNITGLNGTNQDILSSAQNAKGQMFVAMASRVVSGADNKLLLLNSSYNGKTWMVPIGRKSFEEWNNKHYYSSNSSNGFNAVAANNNYVFVYDGRYIRAFNTGNGAFLGEEEIAAHTVKMQGGIVADECNNIYVGSRAGTILVYNFNGNTFSAKNNIRLQGVNTEVYDLKFNPFNKMIYFCGYGAVGRIMSTETCKTDSSLPVSLQVDCENMFARISVSDTSNKLDYSFIWKDITSGNTVKYSSGKKTADTLFNPLPGHEYSVQIVKSTICNLAGALLSFQFCDTVYNDVSRTICPGDTFKINGKSFWKAGDYKDTITDRFSKTHHIQIKIKVYSVVTDSVYVSVCKGNTYRYRNNSYTENSIITDTLTSYAGCDSIVRLILTFSDNLNTYLEPVICYGDTFKVGNTGIYTTDGQYTDSLKSVNGCDSIVHTKLKVRFSVICACGKAIRMPNVFTPNGDSYNGHFPDTKVEGMTLSVYNRWGNPVYQNTEGSGWDGMVNGERAPDGTYYYLMEFTDCKGTLIKINGVVRLIY